MISVKVLGPGCSNCVKVADIARNAVGNLGAEADIVKITDFAQIRKCTRFFPEPRYELAAGTHAREAPERIY